MKAQHFKLRILPTYLFTAFIILIVKAHPYNLDFENMPNLPMNSSTTLWDAFNYAKSTAIFAITVYAAITMVYLLLTGQLKIKKTKIYIPMIIYMLGVFVSYLMSDFKWLSLYGSMDRFEGTRTILCYIFMLFYTINVIDDKRDVLIMIFITLVGTFIACIIGITQLLGADFFLTDVGYKIVTGSDSVSIKPAFTSGQVYQTVANMNYVGMYLSLIVPILVFAIYYLCKKENRLNLTEFGIYNNKRILIIILLSLFLFLIVLNIYGTHSLGGLIGIVTSLTVLLLLLIQNKRLKIAVLTAFIVSLIGVSTCCYINSVDDHNITGHRHIEFIETGIDYVTMSIDDKILSVLYNRNDKSYELKDENNEPVNIFWFADDENTIQVDDERFGGKIQFVPLFDENGEACVLVDIKENDPESFGFTFYEDGARYLNPFGNEVPLEKIESIGFKNHLSAGSGRAYIWSRTLPLLKNKILTGYGADTFIAVFPHNDYAGKYTSGTPLSTVIDKSHNMYLNMAIGTGILSMIAFLAIVVMALWNVFHLGTDKLYIKVIAAGIVGFLVAGLFNDSTVGIMPMFYGLLGIVIAKSSL